MEKGEERTAALVMEASLTGLGGQSLAWSHLRSASSSATEEPATQERLQTKEKFTSGLKHQKFTVLTSACDMKHIGRNLLGVAPTPGEVIQQPHLHLEVGEHLNNVNVKQERFNRHPAEGSQVEKLQEQGNCDTGGLNGEKGKEISVRDVTSVGQRSSPVPCPGRGQGRIQPRVQAGFYLPITHEK